jgi:5'-nucleotidase / UDP-sugar diphosphatase
MPQIPTAFLLRLLLLCAVLFPAGGEVRRLTILHTNDIHAHLLPDGRNQGGFAQLATILRRERAGCDHCLYLNAGDLVQGTPVSTLFRGAPVYDIANMLHIDAATLGNHEFDYGWRQTQRFMKIANYPVVSANVVDAQNTAMTQPYVIKTVNGIRVAIIGAVMSALVSGYLTAETAGPFKALPVVETVSRYAKELRHRADLILVLGHIELKEGDEILRNVPEVSVVIEGHVHAGMKEAAEVEGRVAVLCRSYGVELGRLDLEVDMESKKLSSWQWKRLPVDASAVAADKEVKKAVHKWEQRVSKIVDIPIGEAKRDYETAELRRIVEDAILAGMHADFTFVNAGGIRDRLVKGTILARNIWNILPFDNQVVVASVPGRDISASIRRDRAVEPDRLYTLALPDYVVENESQRTRLGLSGITFKKLPESLRDVVIHWVRQKRILE